MAEKHLHTLTDTHTHTSLTKRINIRELSCNLFTFTHRGSEYKHIAMLCVRACVVPNCVVSRQYVCRRLIDRFARESGDLTKTRWLITSHPRQLAWTECKTNSLRMRTHLALFKPGENTSNNLFSLHFQGNTNMLTCWFYSKAFGLTVLKMISKLAQDGRIIWPTVNPLADDALWGKSGRLALRLIPERSRSDEISLGCSTPIGFCACFFFFEPYWDLIFPTAVRLRA